MKKSDGGALRMAWLLVACMATWLGAQPGARRFVHPGIYHTKEDLERIKTMVAEGRQPWKAAWDRLRTAGAEASVTYRPRPVASVCRGITPCNNQNNSLLQHDASAAYYNAVQWAISGNEAHARKALEIINGWSAILREIVGRDAILAAGIYGHKFVAAAEIMRYTYPAWAPADITRAENMFRNVFYPVIKDFGIPMEANGNWDTAAMAAMMGIAVFTNDQAMFDKVVDYYHNGSGNGSLPHYVVNEAGQCQESGRDQPHTGGGLGHLAEVAEIGWNQGLDLYGALGNRLFKGFEYSSSYNLGNTVPFQAWTDVYGKYRHTAISASGRGALPGNAEMVYNHYRNRRGMEAPQTQRAAERNRPEGLSIDLIGVGTLLFTRPYAPITSGIQSGSLAADFSVRALRMESGRLVLRRNARADQDPLRVFHSDLRGRTRALPLRALGGEAYGLETGALPPGMGILRTEDARGIRLLGRVR